MIYWAISFANLANIAAKDAMKLRCGTELIQTIGSSGG